MPLATAVILSYNRQDALRRQLLYYANKPLHLIFADGSDDDWGSGESGSIGEMTWEYFRISGFDSWIPRVRTAVAKVDSEFMFFLDDEECILFTGIERAINFLIQNLDHSCAGGRADTCTFTFIKRRIVIGPWGRRDEPFELLQPSGLERFESMCTEGRTANLFYQIQRSKNVRAWVGALDPAFKPSGNYPGFLEIAFTGSLSLLGKWKMSSYPFWIRFGSLGLQSGWSTAPAYISSNQVFELESIIDKAVNLGGGIQGQDGIGFKRSLTAEIIEKNFGKSSLKKSESLVESMQTLSARRKFAKRVLKFAVRLSGNLWKFSPRIYDLLYPLYELLYPQGPKTVSSFGKSFGSKQSAVFSDIYSFGEIWSKFPYGLDTDQLREELRLRANI